MWWVWRFAGTCRRRLKVAWLRFGRKRSWARDRDPRGCGDDSSRRVLYGSRPDGIGAWGHPCGYLFDDRLYGGGSRHRCTIGIEMGFSQRAHDGSTSGKFGRLGQKPLIEL